MPEHAPLRGLVAGAANGAEDARSLWRALGEAGVIERVGWTSKDPDDIARLDDLLSELDGRLPLGLVLSVCVQVALAVPLLATASETSGLAREVLADAVAGRAVVAIAVTEAGLSGSATLDAATAVRSADGSLRLTGGKEWISNARHCDHVMVLARCRPERHITSFCWVLIPAVAPGVTVEPASNRYFGQAGVGHLRFDDVALAEDRVVGQRGRALAEFVRALQRERLAGALWGRALCRRVLVETLDHLRRAAGGPDDPLGQRRHSRSLRPVPGGAGPLGRAVLGVPGRFGSTSGGRSGGHGAQGRVR